MRIMVFSDVHGNLTALEAVLQHAGRVDAYWCLGDLVGYGPDPEACVARIRSLPNLVCLQGNHDAAATGLLPPAWFNADARSSLEWTRKQLSSGALKFLRKLSPLQILPQWDVTLFHGSLLSPLEEYLTSTERARASLEKLRTTWGCFGHTHVPTAFVYEKGRVTMWIPQGAQVSCKVSPRSLFNPGSVGQPRDGDPRASYAIYDTETQTWTWYRVPYRIKEVQDRIWEAGLPPRHAIRLAYGR